MGSGVSNQPHLIDVGQNKSHLLRGLSDVIASKISQNGTNPHLLQVRVDFDSIRCNTTFAHRHTLATTSLLVRTVISH